MVSNRMKCLRALFLLVSIASTAWSATLPLYQNDIQFQGEAPQIDAVRFVNNSLFYINASGSGIPYDTSNTRFFTNNGQMYNYDGFRIENVAGSKRLMMDAFSNPGTIQAGVYFSVQATNISSPGFIYSGGSGILAIDGKSVDLSNGGFETGGGSSGSAFSTVYYAIGTGNDLSGTNVYTIDLMNYQLPDPQSPRHEVFLATAGSTKVAVPSFPNPTRPYSAYVYTNGNTVQIVFAPDTVNDIDGNPLVTTQVKFTTLSSTFFGGFFGGGFGGGISTGDLSPIVEFASPQFDIVTDSVVTNYLYFEDGSATTTNYFLFSNGNGGGIPSTYSLTSSQPFGWSPFYSTNANENYSPSLIYAPAFVTNTVTNSYFAYSADVGPATLASGQSVSNLVGRIAINANNLNLKGSRIKADTALIINASNLVDNVFPLVDAPYVAYNLGSTNGKLTLGNVGGDLLTRFGGTFSAWTGIWYNKPSTNANAPTLKYHILFVDFVPRTGVLATQIDSLGANAKHVVINGAADSINNSLKINAKALTITPSGSLGYSYSFSSSGSALGIASNNVPSLYLLTNQGGIFVNGVLNFGADRPKAYSNIINSGTMQSAATYLRSSNLTDTGTIYANSGALSVDVVHGLFSGDLILTYASIRIKAREMVASNSFFSAGYGGLGRIELSVTNDLNDGGKIGANTWQTTAGFSLSRRPKKTSSLLGTSIQSTVQRFQNSSHVWASTNLGAVAAGYSNNAALGRLVLNGQGDTFSTFSFSGVGKNSAIYVDYLDFRNYATNYLLHLSIATNFTIYFADSNLKAEQLNGALGGRIRWVPSYAGPNSSVTVTNLAGDVFKVNRQLAKSTTIDSDGDGIPNASDPLPWEYIAPSIFTQPTDQTVNIGSKLSISAVIRGAPPLKYQWYRNGAKVAGGTNAVLVIPNVQLANAGSYLVVVDNSLGSATSESAVITVINPYQTRSGAYSGLFGNPASYQFASSGSAQLTMSTRGAFSGQIRIEGGTYSFSGSFNSDGASTVLVPRAGKTTLTCQFTMDLVGTSPITGTAGDGAFLVPARLDRAVFSDDNPAPYAGEYTLVIPGSSPVAGDGIGTLTVSSLGAVTFSGVLADGTPITQSADLSESGMWPVYLPLYTGKGMMISWVQFRTNAPATLSGNAVWTKNPVPGDYYPAGFRINSTVNGNAYVPPASGMRVLNMTNGTVTLSSGNLATSITNTTALGDDNLLTITGTNNLSLTVTLSNGLINGSFQHPVTQLATPIVGVVRQGTNIIQGHFLGTSQSGRMFLRSAP